MRGKKSETDGGEKAVRENRNRKEKISGGRVAKARGNKVSRELARNATFLESLRFSFLLTRHEAGECERKRECEEEAERREGKQWSRVYRARNELGGY